MEEFRAQGNKCYFVSQLRWHLDGMAFHSLKNQTFRERSSQSERRGAVIKGERKAQW